MRSIGPCLAVLCLLAMLVVDGAAAAPEREALEARAQRLGRQAAEATVLEDAVPFIDASAEREEALREHPASTVDQVMIETDGEPIRAWWVRATRGLVSKGLVIVLPGWKSNAGFALGQSDFLLAEGYRLLIVEDRANAHAGGDAKSFKGFLKQDLADLERVLAHVKERAGQALEPTALYGFSWGGTRALLLAEKHPELRAVIVDAAPASATHHAVETFIEYMPPDARSDAALREVFFLAFDARVEELLGYRPRQLDVKAAAARVTPRPLLVIHSTDDDFVPFADGQALFAAAKEPKTFLRGTDFGHCLGMRRQPDRYVPAVLEFLERSLTANPRRATDVPSQRSGSKSHQ